MISKSQFVIFSALLASVGSVAGKENKTTVAEKPNEAQVSKADADKAIAAEVSKIIETILNTPDAANNLNKKDLEEVLTIFFKFPGQLKDLKGSIEKAVGKEETQKLLAEFDKKAKAAPAPTPVAAAPAGPAAAPASAPAAAGPVDEYKALQARLAGLETKIKMNPTQAANLQAEVEKLKAAIEKQSTSGKREAIANERFSKLKNSVLFKTSVKGLKQGMKTYKAAKKSLVELTKEESSRIEIARQKIGPKAYKTMDIEGIKIDFMHKRADLLIVLAEQELADAQQDYQEAANLRDEIKESNPTRPVDVAANASDLAAAEAAVVKAENDVKQAIEKLILQKHAAKVLESVNTSTQEQIEYLKDREYDGANRAEKREEAYADFTAQFKPVREAVENAWETVEEAENMLTSDADKTDGLRSKVETDLRTYITGLEGLVEITAKFEADRINVPTVGTHVATFVARRTQLANAELELLAAEQTFSLKQRELTIHKDNLKNIAEKNEPEIKKIKEAQKTGGKQISKSKIDQQRLEKEMEAATTEVEKATESVNEARKKVEEKNKEVAVLTHELKFTMAAFEQSKNVPEASRDLFADIYEQILAAEKQLALAQEAAAERKPQGVAVASTGAPNAENPVIANLKKQIADLNARRVYMSGVLQKSKSVHKGIQDAFVEYHAQVNILSYSLRDAKESLAKLQATAAQAAATQSISGAQSGQLTDLADLQGQIQAAGMAIEGIQGQIEAKNDLIEMCNYPRAIRAVGHDRVAELININFRRDRLILQRQELERAKAEFEAEIGSQASSEEVEELERRQAVLNAVDAEIQGHTDAVERLDALIQLAKGAHVVRRRLAEKTKEKPTPVDQLLVELYVHAKAAVEKLQETYADLKKLNNVNFSVFKEKVIAANAKINETEALLKLRTDVKDKTDQAKKSSRLALGLGLGLGLGLPALFAVVFTVLVKTNRLLLNFNSTEVHSEV